MRVIDIGFKQSKDIYDFKPLLGPLSEDFGHSFLHTVLCWCGLIEDIDNKYWQSWLVTEDAADPQSKVIGLCGLYSLNDSTDELWLGWFGLIPEWRNCGVGNAVLIFLEEQAIAVGCRKLMAYVDKQGRPLSFYYRNGFSRLSSVGEYLRVSESSELNQSYFCDVDDHVIEKNLKISS
jgi:GNAT superfamily N-acetyltransferase